MQTTSTMPPTQQHPDLSHPQTFPWSLGWLYGVCFGALFVLFEYASLHILPKNTASLGTLHHQSTQLLQSHLAIIGVSFLVGFLAGCLLFLCFFPLYYFRARKWISGSLWLAFLVILIGILLLHWLSIIIFDIFRTYPQLQGLGKNMLFDPILFLKYVHFVGVFVYNSKALFLDYLPTPHILFACVAVSLVFFLPRWWKRQSPKFLSFNAFRYGNIALLVCSALCIAWLPLQTPAYLAYPACKETTLLMFLLAPCKQPELPKREKPTTAKGLALIAHDEQQRQKKQRPLHLQEYIYLLHKARPTSRPTSRPAPDKPPTRRPNIVYVLLESIHSHYTGVYDPKYRDVTPFLNQFTKQHCARFRWAFSNGNISRFGITAAFGGQYAVEPTVPRNFMYQPLLPELLKLSGYQIGHFGHLYRWESLDKWMHYAIWDRYFDSHEPKTWKLPFDKQCDIDCQMFQEMEHWFKNKDKKRPFYVSFTPYATHFPYSPPLYKQLSAFWRQPLEFSFLHIAPHRRSYFRERYLRSLRYVDGALKQMITQFKKRGEFENTFFVIVSDHGEDLYKHSDPFHGTNLYNPQIQIPMFLCSAGIKPSWRNENASLIDIAPTVLAKAGLPPHPAYTGKDLLAAKTLRSPRPIFNINYMISHSVAIILGPYKYIYNFTRRQEMLFNIHKDPKEQHSILHQEPDVVKAMRWIFHAKLDEEKRKKKHLNLFLRLPLPSLLRQLLHF